jgi:hypothetical protein
MTQEEFIKVLNDKGYYYEIKEDKIIVTYKVNVWLDSLTSLPPGVEFKNEGNVNLDSITSLPPGVEFNNTGSVNLRSLIGGDGLFHKWKGNIEGIDSKRLLNFMISKGVFI